MKQFIYKNKFKKVYYLAEKEYDNYNDVYDQILHREDGPAYISYYKDGIICYEQYFINGKIHREDGPAWIWYDKDGSIRLKAYYIDDKKHRREDRPAWIEYYKDGNIKYEEYWINNKPNREGGASRTRYYKDGSINYKYYYLDDKNYTKEEYDRELRRRNTKIGRELYE